MVDRLGFQMLAFLAILMMGAGVALAESASEESSDSTADEAQAKLPETLPVIDTEGLQALIDESAESGQILVVDFWATWCVPCVAMFPGLHEAMIERGESVRAVSVTLDEPGEWETRAIEFLAEHHALKDAYLLVPDSKEQMRVVDTFGQKWDNLVVPAILVFDTNGELSGEFLEGGDSAVDAIAQHVDDLIEKSQESEEP